MSQAAGDLIVGRFNDDDTRDSIVASFKGAIESLMAGSGTLPQLAVSILSIEYVLETAGSSRRLSDEPEGYLNVEYEVTLPAEYAGDFLQILEDLGADSAQQAAFIDNLEELLEAAGVTVDIVAMKPPAVPTETEAAPTTAEPAEESNGTSGGASEEAEAPKAAPPNSGSTHTTAGLWAAIVLGGVLAHAGGGHALI